MTLRILGTSLIFAVGSGSAHAQHAWVKCLKTEDCVKVRTVCDGVGSINGKYLKAQAESIRRAETMIRCRPPGKAELARNRRLVPICEGGTCGLVAEPETTD